MKKLGQVFMAVGGISVFIICGSEYESMVPAFLFMGAAALMVFLGMSMVRYAEKRA